MKFSVCSASKLKASTKQSPNLWTKSSVDTRWKLLRSFQKESVLHTKISQKSRLNLNLKGPSILRTLTGPLGLKFSFTKIFTICCSQLRVSKCKGTSKDVFSIQTVSQLIFQLMIWWFCSFSRFSLRQGHITWLLKTRTIFWNRRLLSES